MNTIKGLVNGIVVLMKLLIWTLIIFYGFIGFWYLIHGNPKKSYTREGEAVSFAVQAFFYTVIVFPLIYIFLLIQVESVYFLKEIMPPIFITYFCGMIVAVFFGLINLLTLSDE